MASTVPRRLGRLFEALDATEIRWSLLRPRELLAQAQGDIDILVSPSDLASAERVLTTQGFLSMGGTPADRHAVDHDPETGRFLWIHLQSVVSVAGATFPAAEALETAGSDTPPQLGEAWLFWILMLRALVEKGGIPERHRIHLQSFAPSALAAPDAWLALCRSRGLDPGRVRELAAGGNWAELEGLAPDPAAGRRNPLRALARRTRVLIRRDTDCPGLTVAVLGPDGAGKTTLVRSLNQSLPVPTRIQYLGLTGGRMPRADALRIPGVVLAARLLILWSRYLRGAYFRRRGRIVLFERYVLDAVAPSGVELRPIARLSRRMQRWALPMPELVLLLDASGETLFRRSLEYDPARLEDWRQAFRSLESSVSQLEILDAERPLEDVLLDAQQRIWRRYRTNCAATAARWHRRPGAPGTHPGGSAARTRQGPNRR